MTDFQNQRQFKKIFHSRYTIIVLIIVLILICRAVWGIYVKYEKSKAITKRAESDLVILEERQKTLTQSIQSLQTEEGKEKELRDRFGVVREGETMVVVVDDKEPVKTGTKDASSSWWQSIINLFK